jgi:hypothetical protein
MAEIINLRRARKAKGRVEAEKAAAQNRMTFGRSKTEKALSAVENELATRRLDNHKREE